MNVLAFESSCDETGVALVSTQAVGLPKLRAHALYSQVQMHAAYGGVVPELASRDHIRRALPLTRQVLQEAGATLAEVDVVAFTRGPGLAGALLVGAGVACALAAALGKPTLGVHHLEGHLLSPFLSTDAPEFPFVALLVPIAFVAVTVTAWVVLFSSPAIEHVVVVALLVVHVAPPEVVAV